MCTIKSVLFETLPNNLDLTTVAVKVRVIKTNNASITDHKPGDVAGPDRSQDAVKQHYRES